MKRPAELHLALDIDQVAAAHADAGGDAARLAEGGAADLDDREAVDLADGLAIGIDQDGLLDDLLLEQRVEPVVAAELSVPGLLARPRGETTALPAFFEKCAASCMRSVSASMSEESLPAWPESRAAYSVRAATARTWKSGSPSRRAVVAMSRGNNIVVLIVALDHVVEIRDHLEMLAEFGVGIGQQVIQHPLANQHHFERRRGSIPGRAGLSAGKPSAP